MLSSVVVPWITYDQDIMSFVVVVVAVVVVTVVLAGLTPVRKACILRTSSSEDAQLISLMRLPSSSESLTIVRRVSHKPTFSNQTPLNHSVNELPRV